jgi:hypothetical protein
MRAACGFVVSIFGSIARGSQAARQPPLRGY